MQKDEAGRPRRQGRCRGLGIAIAVALAAPHAALADGSTGHRRAGDILRFAIPAATLTTELVRDENEGALEFAEVFAVTVLGTEVLQRTTHVERPDRSNDRGFPSGHASSAFSGATYVHRRYGLEPALPLYALGTYVGWTRVQAHRHRWPAVAGSLALSAGASWWLVTPRPDRHVAIVPEVAPDFVGIRLLASW